MRKLLRFVAIAGPLVAALGVAVYAVAVTPQKALIYCPVAIDSIGCHNVVGALSGPNGPFPNGVDRGYDGTAGTVDLATADLSPYAVFIIPSLADDSVSKPYELLRNSRIAYRLSLALEGRLVVWSGTPDQGTQSRDLKDKLIRNLAVWARGADSAAATGLVVLGDHSEVASQRYAWLAGFAGLAVSPDTVAQVYDSVKTLTATGIAILDNGGTQLAYPAMASFGVRPPAAASGAAVDARGGSAEGQVVLVTSPRRLASVKTDKPDYSPGETVTFTGSGWEPGEVVSLLLHEDPTTHPDRTLTATADPLGNIVNNEFSPEPHDVGVTFYVLASGQVSRIVAQARFTDTLAPTNTTEIHDANHTVVTSVPVGTTVHDKATVSGTAGTPTGTVTFKWFTSGTCTGMPAATSSPQTLVNGMVDATGFSQTPAAPGSYAFEASYSGDDNYTSGPKPCEVLTVTARTPTVATEIHNASHAVVTSVPAGSTVHDKATVSGSFGTPTGTVTFTFFTTSSTCTGTSVASGTVTLDASGVAHPSASQGPLSAGSYSFIAHYNGDPNYTATDSPCEPLEVTALTPTALTEIHNASHNVVVAVPAGTTVHDKATLAGAFGTPTGTVTFTFFTTSSTCTGTSVASGTVTLDASGVAHPSASQGPLSAGSYSFIAHYNGDPNYTATDRAHERTTVTDQTRTPPTACQNTSHNVVVAVPAGTTVHDKATVSGSFVTPSPTRRSSDLTTSSTCTGTSVGSGTVTLDASGVAHPSASQGPLSAGSYSFIAHYNGDPNYTATDSPCEPLTVTALTPTVATEIHNASHAVVTSVPAGSTVHDKATVSGSFGTPTGTVTFTFFTTSSTCTGTSVGSRSEERRVGEGGRSSG